jgi:hypothetical protein
VAANVAWIPGDVAERAPSVRRCAALEISQEGLSLRSPVPIPAGTLLAIKLRLADCKLVLWGRVAHCTLGTGAFHVGVQLRFPEGHGSGMPCA